MNITQLLLSGGSIQGLEEVWGLGGYRFNPRTPPPPSPEPQLE